MTIGIAGVYTTKFGELWSQGFASLMKEAIYGALEDANLEIKNLDAIYVGNMLSGNFGDQEQLGAAISGELGLNIPAIKVEAACASGGIAVHQACQAVKSGSYQTVLALGIEKMTDYAPEEVAAGLMQAASEDERIAGLTFPALYALMARAHMQKYGTTESQLALVAVKNHFHASLNCKAQYPFTLTKQDVLNSTCIADPLKLYDCSPITDGASAVILTAKNQQVKILASQVATDSTGLAGRESITEIKATKLASQKAFASANIDPQEINVAELHDCFTIAEILALEDIGFVKKGEAGPRLEKGQFKLGSKGLIVNTSGGLKAAGHPVGATGVKQVVEIVEQLRGSAGKRQVKGEAKLGLTHNIGGSGGTAVIHILTNKGKAFNKN
ncbi:acetyl-CoA acetyltransferase [Candidatus Roizmanbacteria bacterium CG22_combo_CG10-13_8_21_14_all_38_20]|uniref:Acetyl-CoA acetyltransferase n=1 Tax=Candidatus Roizmanbacteria bacterium CG22_combo_CG10-13_8_21_14_all_38_20 TaxID=1974862 RepID=A0A2H0BUD9_9BACT|nr:thiolase domain-containing protein [Candidatus Microgenomates bacterium]PIP61241.1 MAG: acetyl-CoA acetyltransferase [Candidatus Roizmanbacteria bacterium CG22_combo_CG10-13_8_21_14_all_38_20]PJC31231.1 MAG: acetyl-CoA acetyltransferase [Candidatus Roizmanbacteria bacterium CG_4_9_14_0_2_um_filter_38_17]